MKEKIQNIKNDVTIDTVKMEKLEKNNKTRLEYLDIARTFAIISVVLCHAVELVYQMKLKGLTILSFQSQLFRLISFTFGRLGVPIFLFITGTLILNKKIGDDQSCKKFYIKNLLPLLITNEIWVIIYNIFIPIYNHTKFDFFILVRNMLFLEKVPLANMWYMPMIIGIYIAIPFVNKIVRTFSIKSLKLPMIVIFILQFTLPTVNVLLNMFGLETYHNILDVSFLGGAYGFYIISGYLISKKNIMKKIKSIWIIIVMTIFFILSCTIQLISYRISKGYNIWYNSVFIFICTACIFELFTRININKINKKIIKCCTYISKISLAIFFLHIIIEKIVSKYINTIIINNPIKVMIIFTSSFLISMMIIFILSKIKIVKNKFFLIKE